MVNRLKMIAQRLTANRDAMLNNFRRLAQRERVAFNRVRGVRQVNVKVFLQSKQRLA